MLLPLISILALGQQKILQPIPVDFPKSTQPNIPLRIKDSPPKATLIDGHAWVRGHLPVLWVYEIPMEYRSLDDLLAATNRLPKGTKWTFNRYEDSHTKLYERQSGGVLQQVLIMSGRREFVVDPEQTWMWQNLHDGYWSTVIVRESVEETGSLPKRWPKKAIVPNGLPNGLKLPLSVLRGVAPTLIHRSETPAPDGVQYGITYHLDRPFLELNALASKELGPTPFVSTNHSRYSGSPSKGYVGVELTADKRGGTKIVVSCGNREHRPWWGQLGLGYPGLDSLYSSFRSDR